MTSKYIKRSNCSLYANKELFFKCIRPFQFNLTPQLAISTENTDTSLPYSIGSPTIGNMRVALQFRKSEVSLSVAIWIVWFLVVFFNYICKPITKQCSPKSTRSNAVWKFISSFILKQVSLKIPPLKKKQLLWQN